MASGKETAKECKEYAASECLGQVCRSLGHVEDKNNKYGRQTRSWILFMPNHANDTALVFQEWWDALLTCYVRVSGNMPNGCDVFGEKHSLHHTLSCKVGGLVHVNFNKVVGNIGHHACLTHPPQPPSKGCSKPQITSCCD